MFSFSSDAHDNNELFEIFNAENIEQNGEHENNLSRSEIDQTEFLTAEGEDDSPKDENMGTECVSGKRCHKISQILIDSVTNSSPNYWFNYR